MKRRGSLGLRVIAGMVTLGLLAAACVPRERDFGAGGAGTGGGMSSSSSGAGGMMSSSSAGTTSSSSGMSKGCTGATDMMILADMATINMAAYDCGMMCFGQMNKSACAASCMEMKTQLSPGCSQCWGDLVACGINNCLQQCIQWGSQQCMDCLAMHCGPAYQACSGL